MYKLVRRLLFGELYNINEYEGYFSEMSAMGFHIKKIGKFFLYFEEGEPKYLKYRIDMVKKDKKEEKEGRITSLRTKGWDFVCEKDMFLLFSSPENSNLKELYDTPEEQRLAIREANNKIHGRKLTNIIFSIIGIAVVFYIFYIKLFVKRNFFLSLNDIESFIKIISLFLPILSSTRGRRSIEKLEKTLAGNEFLSHQGDYLLLKTRYILRKLMYFLLMVVVIVSGLISVLRNEEILLEEIEDLESLPVITLEYIEKEPLIPDIQAHRRDGNFYYGNVLHKNWSLFMPKYYILVESGKFRDSNEKTISLESDYYLASFDFIAEGLVGDIRHREADKGKALNFIKTQKEDNISVAYGFETEDEIILLCRYGRQVIYLRYENGSASMEDLVDLVMDKLKKNQQVEI